MLRRDVDKLRGCSLTELQEVIDDFEISEADMLDVILPIIASEEDVTTSKFAKKCWLRVNKE